MSFMLILLVILLVLLLLILSKDIYDRFTQGYKTAKKLKGPPIYPFLGSLWEILFITSGKLIVLALPTIGQCEWQIYKP